MSVTVVQETPPTQEGQRFCSEAQIAGITVSQLRREGEGDRQATPLKLISPGILPQGWPKLLLVFHHHHHT